MFRLYTCLLTLVLLGSSAALRAQSCISACPSSGLSTDFEWIRTISVGPLFNNSGNNGGYADFGTTFPASFSAGSTYSFTVVPGYGDGPFSETWRAWVDLNQDGDFDDPDELIFSAFGQFAQSGSFSIPASALNGLTRLRIAMSFAVPPSCGDFPEGEVEDYCITINGGVSPSCDASTPVSGLSASVSASQVTLSWNTVTASVACRVSGGLVPGFSRSIVRSGSGVNSVSIPIGLLDAGVYNWKVACACSLSPLLTTPDSAVDTFTVPALRNAVALSPASSPILWPNPSSGEVWLSLDAPATSWTVFDLSGRAVLHSTQALEVGQNRLQFGDLAPGTYQLMLQHNGQDHQTLSFIVE